MATKLLPSTKFTASKKIISADSIKSVSKDSSTTEKLGAIRKFLLIDYKGKRVPRWNTKAFFRGFFKGLREGSS